MINTYEERRYSEYLLTKQEDFADVLGTLALAGTTAGIIDHSNYDKTPNPAVLPETITDTEVTSSRLLAQLAFRTEPSISLPQLERATNIDTDLLAA